MTRELFILGMGPGDTSLVPPATRYALERCSDLVAYPLYLDLLGDLVAGKTRHDLPLGQEVDRARLALDLAAAGKPTALISSGDAGIYAMATLVFELLDHDARPQWQEVAIQVVPGISAIQAAAARVGAPIAHDFCTISLSDLLTPWSVIENRVEAAGLGDFVVAFYNPVSRQRHWQLDRALEILRQHRPPDTPVVVARNLSRADETVSITTLSALSSTQVDMFTLVLVGNRDTRRVGDWVYTPRGYAGRRHAVDTPGATT